MNDNHNTLISVSLVYALDADQQAYCTLMVPVGSTVEQVIQNSNIIKSHPEINNPEHSVGIWYKAAQKSDTVQSGDRIEIYRPLPLSAMDARIQRKNKAL